jgi:hypothetical protein
MINKVSCLEALIMDRWAKDHYLAVDLKVAYSDQGQGFFRRMQTTSSLLSQSKIGNTHKISIFDVILI